jgi:hypothetical protein
MLVDRVTLSAAGGDRVMVSWTTAHPAWPAWLFVDGVFCYGPMFFDATTIERSVPVRVYDARAIVVEVHETPTADMIVQPCVEPRRNLPTISWNAIDPQGQTTYRIHHKPPGGDDSVLFEGRVPADALNICHIRSPIALGGVDGQWHCLRVECLDAFGRESQREAWLEWAAEPSPVPELSITAGSAAGLYTLTLQE